MTTKEKIMRIMALALEINPPEVENVGEKRTAVFVEYSPHCNCFRVRIFIDGWDSCEYADEYYQLYLKYESDRTMLDHIIRQLEAILQEYAECQ